MEAIRFTIVELSPSFFPRSFFLEDEGIVKHRDVENPPLVLLDEPYLVPLRHPKILLLSGIFGDRGETLF